MDWRKWAYELLSSGLTVPVLGAGSVVGSPPDARPFVQIMMDPTTPGPFPGSSSRSCVVWAHDKPGSYLAIDGILGAARAILVGRVARQGAICAEWAGDSQDLSDESYGTICRYATFRLHESETV